MATPDRGLEPGGGPAGPRRSRWSAPRWVKVFVVVGVVLGALVVVMALFGPGPGGHGPARHLASDGVAGAGAPVVAAPLAAHGLLGGGR